MHGQKLLPLIGLLRTPKAVSENPVNPFSSASVYNKLYLADVVNCIRIQGPDCGEGGRAELSKDHVLAHRNKRNDCGDGLRGPCGRIHQSLHHRNNFEGCANASV